MKQLTDFLPGKYYRIHPARYTATKGNPIATDEVMQLLRMRPSYEAQLIKIIPANTRISVRESRRLYAVKGANLDYSAGCVATSHRLVFFRRDDPRGKSPVVLPESQFQAIEEIKI